MKYRKKPVVIEAIEVTDFSFITLNNILEFMGEKVGDEHMAKEDFIDFHQYVNMNNGIYISTLEGNIKASLGDYIIKGVQGEFYPCKPDIFRMTYEQVLDQ